MASLIPASGVLLNHAARANAPSKDYCQIYVTTQQVIFRIWTVTLRKKAAISPGEIKDSIEDFEHDERAHSEIQLAFGKEMLDYVKALAHGNIDYLARLPISLLIRIIEYIPLEDLAHLAQVSKMFRELARSDDLWQQLYFDHTQAPITHELETLADAVGWRKLFFTNKLQLQVLLKRLSSGELNQASWARHLNANEEYEKTHSHEEVVIKVDTA